MKAMKNAKEGELSLESIKHIMVKDTYMDWILQKNQLIDNFKASIDQQLSQDKVKEIYKKLFKDADDEYRGPLYHQVTGNIVHIAHKENFQ